MSVALPAGPVTLRSFRPGDEVELARRANHREVARRLRDRFPHPYGVDDARAWIAFATSQRPETNLAIVEAGVLVGGIGLVPGGDVYRRSAELGYWLAPEAWGRGLATAAVSAIVPWAFEALGVVRVWAAVFDGNVASARVLEKCGFAFEGRHRAAVTKEGATLDELVYARLAP